MPLPRQNPVPEHNTTVSRRHFLRDCGVGLGKVAVAGLLTESLRSAGTTIRPRGPHFPGKAKAHDLEVHLNGGVKKREDKPEFFTPGVSTQQGNKLTF